MIRAVIFDLDGTLVDTTHLYLDVYMRILQEIGISVDPKTVQASFGKKARDIMVDVLRAKGITPAKIDIESIVDEIKEAFMKRLQEITILPGAIPLLESLKGKYKLAIATSGRAPPAYNILSTFGLLPYFDVVVTGDEVEKAKPSPLIFLLAAKRLGEDPKNCLVFEDTVYGVIGAKRAGMKVVAVATGANSREELAASGPDLLINSLSEFHPSSISTM